MKRYAEDPKALIVDDDPAVRRALTRLAERVGVPVSVAATAEEALAFTRLEHYRLIVLDLRLPGMQGEELLLRMRAMLPEAQLAVLTGDRAADTKLADVVLHKPWDEQALETLLRQATAARRRESVTPTQLPANGNSESAVLRMLVVEDCALDARVLETTLGKSGLKHALARVATLGEARDALSRERFDVVVTDLELPDSHGLATVYAMLGAAHQTPLLVLTGSDDEDLAGEAVQAGAQDYLVKARLRPDSLARALRLAVDRKRGERRIMRLALTDPLTGLANRASFRERLAHAIARSRRTGLRFAVALVDMDDFKGLNDTYGHERGDVFLTQVAARMRLELREVDTVARFGGDEFALLLEAIESDATALEVCERVRRTLGSPFELDSLLFRSSASLGLAIYPNAGQTTDGLLEAADSALYESKRAGRNRVSLCSPGTDPGANRFSWEELGTGEVPSRRYARTSLMPSHDPGEELTVLEAHEWSEVPRLLELAGPGQLVLVDEQDLEDARLNQWHRWQSEGGRLGIGGFGGHRPVHALPPRLPTGLVVLHPRLLALRQTPGAPLLRAVVELASSTGTLTAGHVSSADAERLGLAWSLMAEHER